MVPGRPVAGLTAPGASAADGNVRGDAAHSGAVSEPGGLIAVSATDGALLWESRFALGSAEPPTYADGVVYLGSAGHGTGVSAHRAEDGAPLWHVSAPSGTAAVAVAGDAVYAAFACPHLYGLRRSDGAQLWHVGEPACSGGGGSMPAIHGGRMYVTEEAAGIRGHVYDAGTGALLWRRPMDQQPALAAGTVATTVVPGRGSARLEARDAADGALRWRFRGDGYLGAAPLIVNRVVYAGSGAGRIYGLSLRGGRRVWGTKLRGPIGGLAAGEHLLLVSTFRAIVAYARYAVVEVNDAVSESALV